MISAADRLPCFPEPPWRLILEASTSSTLRYLPVAEAPKRAVSREAYMCPSPGNEKSYLRNDSGVRRAAILVIDEFREDAAEYAATRAMVLQRRGDEIGASAWRRVAPVIEELQRKKRKKSAGSN